MNVLKCLVVTLVFSSVTFADPVRLPDTSFVCGFLKSEEISIAGHRKKGVDWLAGMVQSCPSRPGQPRDPRTCLVTDDVLVEIYLDNILDLSSKYLLDLGPRSGLSPALQGELRALAANLHKRRLQEESKFRAGRMVVEDFAQLVIFLGQAGEKIVEIATRQGCVVIQP